jgi:hypothetical protein
MLPCDLKRCGLAVLAGLALGSTALTAPAAALPREDYEPPPPSEPAPAPAPPTGGTCQAATPACGYYGDLTAPALTAAATGSTTVRLSWTAPAWKPETYSGATGVTGYAIDRRPPGGTFTQIATVGPYHFSHTDSGLAYFTPYEYQVRSLGATKTSNAASATTEHHLAGGALTATGTTPRNITLTWAAPSWQPSWTAPTGVTGYAIERRGAGGSFAEVGRVASDVRSFTDGGLTHSTGYAYRVVSLGRTSTTATVSAATLGPQPATLRFGPDSTTVFEYDASLAVADAGAVAVPFDAKVMTVRNVSTDELNHPIRFEPLRHRNGGTVDTVLLRYNETTARFEGQRLSDPWEAWVTGDTGPLSALYLWDCNGIAQPPNPTGCTSTGRIQLKITWV